MPKGALASTPRRYRMVDGPAIRDALINLDGNEGHPRTLVDTKILVRHYTYNIYWQIYLVYPESHCKKRRETRRRMWRNASVTRLATFTWSERTRPSLAKEQVLCGAGAMCKSSGVYSRTWRFMNSKIAAGKRYGLFNDLLYIRA